MIAHDLSNGTRSCDVQTTSNKTTDFDSFLLTPLVLNGLTECGFVRPSPIQVEAIPLAKCGIDLVCQAKSGTGKTCVLAVCCLETIDVKYNKVQALILAPTREIAHQIHGVVTSIGQFIEGLQCHLFIGGINVATDLENLKNCHVAIGTPGRVKSLLESGNLSPTTIRLFILDEADKLLEKGSFEEQINWIYSTLPIDKQMLALSATYPKSLGDNLDFYMKNPMHVKINPNDVSLFGVVQFVHHVKHHSLPNKLFEEKLKVLMEILKKLPFQQCMVFSNYHSRAEHLSKVLIKQGWPSTHIAGSQLQKDRLDAIDQLKSFKCRILITTDLTSRGIDCDKVNLVINLDMPWDAETYLHRIGRAGRFGSRGIAISLVSELGEEKYLLSNIAKGISRKLVLLPDFGQLNTLWNKLNSFSNLIPQNVTELNHLKDDKRGLDSNLSQSLGGKTTGADTSENIINSTTSSGENRTEADTLGDDLNSMHVAVRLGSMIKEDSTVRTLPDSCGFTNLSQNVSGLKNFKEFDLQTQINKTNKLEHEKMSPNKEQEASQVVNMINSNAGFPCIDSVRSQYSCDLEYSSSNEHIECKHTNESNIRFPRNNIDNNLSEPCDLNDNFKQLNSFGLNLTQEDQSVIQNYSKSTGANYDFTNSKNGLEDKCPLKNDPRISNKNSLEANPNEDEANQVPTAFIKNSFVGTKEQSHVLKPNIPSFNQEAFQRFFSKAYYQQICGFHNRRHYNC